MKKLNLSWVVVLGCIAANSSTFAASIEAARVNGKIITVDQVEAHFAEISKQPSPVPVTRKMALDELIKREVGIAEARRLKLDQDPAVQARMDNVLYYSLIEKKLGVEFEKVSLKDSEAKAWYDKNPDLRTSQIFIALPPNARPEEEKAALDKLNGILATVKANKTTFAEAAQQYSEDPSAAIGGDMDYRMKDRLDPIYYRAAAALSKPGDTATPVRTAYGVSLIRLTARHSWIEVDRAHVKRLIIEEKRQEIIDRYLGELRQKASVSVNKNVI